MRSSTTTARLRVHAAVSPSSGVRNRCSCVTNVNTRAATYSRISTPATTPLTISRWANVASVAPSANSAGINSPVTARASDVACTDADRALNA